MKQNIINAQANNNNILFSGDFGVNPWQRGTSIVSPVQNQYLADCWQWRVAGSGTVTVTQDTDTPTVSQLGYYSANSITAQVTGTNTPASAEYNVFETIIEGYDFVQMAQQPFVISFWVKTFQTGICSVVFRNNGNDRYYVAEFTVASSGVWQRVSLSIPATPSAGTWNYTNGLGLDILIPLNAGSSLRGAAGAWTTGSVVASNNQINIMSSTSNYIKLNSVKVEVGSVSTLFMPLSESEMLRRCQRRFEKTYNQGVNPATNTSTGTFQYSSTGVVASSFVNNFRYKTEKRTTPSVTVYSVAGTSGKVTQSDSSEISVSTSAVGTSSFLMSGTNGALLAGCQGHAIISADF